MKLILISLLIHAAASSCPTPLDVFKTNTRDDEPTYRLPRNIQPDRYYITLHPDLSPDLDPATFTGSVVIELTALENTRNITLKIRALNIEKTSVSIKDSDGETLQLGEIEEDNELEFLIINTVNDLIAGDKYELTIGSYDGILNTQNAGLYLATYIDESGNERRFATTQFESTNARRAFPSFDEPEWKSTFVIRLRRTGEFTSISNEVLVSETSIGGGIFEDLYKESVKMSTYLMAFVVSDFDYIEDAPNHQKVYARPEYIRDGWADYALETGVTALNAIADFVGVPYTMVKLDQIAIPDDSFAPGAMENWGLVTYRESYLLYKDTYTTTRQLQTITTVIAHEYGHQWFGNLVTLSWWRYLWLNEGFATYFEYYAASVIKPSWRLMDQWVLEVVQSAMESDSLDATQPMNFETPTGGSAPGYISYEKAGAVIRMAESFLTTDVFKNGLKIYLENNEFDIAVPDDLYEGWQAALDEATETRLPVGLTVASVFAPWADQKGYPIVNVVRNLEDEQITFSQQRFLLKDYPDEDVDIVWPIPLNFMYSSLDGFDFTVTTADLWLTKPTDTIDLPTVDGFVIVNKRQAGYYRVNYDEKNWQDIIEFLTEDEFTKIDPLNRAQLVDDVFNFARAGVVNYTLAMQLSTYIAKETDFVPLTSFLNALRYLRLVFATTEQNAEQFQRYVFGLINVAAESLTFDEKPEDEHVDKFNRINVMNVLCDLGDSQCREKSLVKFRAWKDAPAGNHITPDTQLYVYCGALRTGSQEDWDHLFEWYQAEKIDIQRTRILNALGCSEDDAIVQRLLDMTLDATVSFYKAADRQTSFASVYNSGRFGVNAVLNYIENNRAKFVDAVGVNINTIVTGLSTKIFSEEQLVEFSSALDTLGDLVAENTRSTAEKTAQDNVEWTTSNLPTILNWIQDYNEPDTTETTAETDSTTESVTDTTTEDVTDTTTEDVTDTTTEDATETDTDGTTPNDVETTTDGTSTVIASLTLLVIGYFLSSVIN